MMTTAERIPPAETTSKRCRPQKRAGRAEGAAAGQQGQERAGLTTNCVGEEGARPSAILCTIQHCRRIRAKPQRGWITRVRVGKGAPEPVDYAEATDVEGDLANGH